MGGKTCRIKSRRLVWMSALIPPFFEADGRFSPLSGGRRLDLPLSGGERLGPAPLVAGGWTLPLSGAGRLGPAPLVLWRAAGRSLCPVAGGWALPPRVRWWAAGRSPRPVAGGWALPLLSGCGLAGRPFLRPTCPQPDGRISPLVAVALVPPPPPPGALPKCEPNSHLVELPSLCRWHVVHVHPPTGLSSGGSHNLLVEAGRGVERILTALGRGTCRTGWGLWGQAARWGRGGGEGRGRPSVSGDRVVGSASGEH